MENSKIIRLLKRLSAQELIAFRDFVQSPYFNKNPRLTSLLNCILERNMLAEEGPEEADFEKISPGQRYEGSRIQDLLYGLMKLLEDFLAMDKFRQNHFMQKINLMMQAYEKDMEPMLSGIEKDIEMLHEKNPVRDSNYFYETFIIHSERDDSFRLLGKRSENDSLQRKADHLDLFYLSVKLKDSCEMVNRSKIVAAKYDAKMLDTIIPWLTEHPETYEEYPAIKIYLNIYLMLTSMNHEKYFFHLEQLAGENEGVFTSDELRSIYGYLQNYCIRRINQGSTGFSRNLFEIYRHISDNGLVFGDNKNMQWDFKNFVSLGLRIKEYAWTLQMINAFKEQLPETIRQNAYAYNLANYYYETGEYKKATRLLNAVEFTDVYYSLGSKAMLLKIYYKVGEEESFYSLVSSFAIYIRRNKLVSKDNVEVHENLIRFTKKAFLLKTKLPYQRKKDYFAQLASLKQKVVETQKVANIDWLLQELEELEEGVGG